MDELVASITLTPHSTSSLTLVTPEPSLIFSEYSDDISTLFAGLSSGATSAQSSSAEEAERFAAEVEAKDRQAAHHRYPGFRWVKGGGGKMILVFGEHRSCIPLNSV
jgi:hypothetical protein